MAEPLHELVILGGGTAGWMAAAMLARFVPPATRITLVESEEIGTVGVGEATIPQIRFLTAGLGLDEDRLLAAVDGTFKLGIRFDDWLEPGSSYMHAFGSIGAGHGVVPFQHWWLRARALGLASPLGRYSPAAAAADAGRFGRRPELQYAYHFDAALLARVLRKVAEASGVTRIEGKVSAVRKQPLGGGVVALQLTDGRTIAGDFFLDCSGFRSVLLGEALGVPFESWADLLPCDRAVAMPSRALRPIPPYTVAAAHQAGWTWRIPLQSRTGNGCVYSSRHMSDEEALHVLRSRIVGEATGEPRLLRFEAGKRRCFWKHNVLAIGLASAFLEPLESTSIHLVQSALARFLELFPRRDHDEAARDAYNRQAHAEIDGVRDFLVLHYHATGRDEPFWLERRRAPLPLRTAEKLRQFQAGGRVCRDGDELFTEVAWLQVMVGQGIVPETWSPLVEGQSTEALESFLKKLAAQASSCSADLPIHEAFVTAHCPAVQAA